MVFPARDKTEYELTNLKPSTSYELYLKADGSKGSSEKSQIYQATTLGERNDLGIELHHCYASFMVVNLLKSYR